MEGYFLELDYWDMPPIITGSVWSNVSPEKPKKNKRREPLGFYQRKNKDKGGKHDAKKE